MTHNESLYLFVKNPRTASLRLKALDSQTSKGTGTGTGTGTGVDHVIGAGAIAVKDLQVGGWWVYRCGWMNSCVCVYVYLCMCDFICLCLSVCCSVFLGASLTSMIALVCHLS